MRFGVLLLLALPLLCAPGLRADDEPATPAALEISRATVLASPGVPAALEAFLPGAGRPARLAWPLPPGPLVVLGLPAEDAAARRVCDVFQLDVDDLAGGYKLWAWRAARRPMVVVMGADAAALQAARFEFDAEAPAEMMAPDMRSLDFRRPNQQAAVVVRTGTRHVRPRYRTRAWWPGERPRGGDALLTAGARANRVWIEAPDAQERSATARHVERLRAQGVTPVFVGGVWGNLSRTNLDMHARAAVHALKPWQELAGARHFALVFDAAPYSHPRDAARAAAREKEIVLRVAAALRPGGLEELVVVPHCHSDRLAQHAAPPADLRDVPEAVVAWSGPSEHALRVTRAQAERRVREAGVPVVLLETWSAAWPGAAQVPTLPRGRAADLHEVLDGVVVVGRLAAAATLESAWHALEEAPFGARELAPLVPADGRDVAAFLGALAGGLEAAHKENLGLIGWMGPLAAETRAAAKRLPDYPAHAALPVVPAPVTMDGRIDERPWGFARPLVRAARGVDVLALSDGHALRFAVRVRKDAVGTRPFLLQVRVEAPGRTDRWHVEISPEGVRFDVSGREGVPTIEPGHVTAAWHAGPEQYAAEIAFDRFALGGEPHAGRLFECAVTWGPERLWPAGSEDDPGALVVTR